MSVYFIIRPRTTDLLVAKCSRSYETARALAAHTDGGVVTNQHWLRARRADVRILSEDQAPAAVRVTGMPVEMV